MGHDEQRKHGGNTPGLVPGRGHERHEEPVRLGDREPGAPAADLTGDAALPDGEGDGSVQDREQDSALGGHVATRSGTTRTPADEQA